MFLFNLFRQGRPFKNARPIAIDTPTTLKPLGNIRQCAITWNRSARPAAWISCADGELRAIVPDLTNWKRGKKEELKPAIQPQIESKFGTEDLPAELLDRARQRLKINFDSTEPNEPASTS